MAAIWENWFEQRGVSYSVTLVKKYKQAEQWKETQSLSRDDLLVAAKVLNECHSWIVFKAQQDRNEGR